MGYIIAIILLIIVVPLIFMMLSRRTSGAGGVTEGQGNRGITVSQPSSDEPTPQAGSINQPKPETERRIPPG
jgi:hypothetical protein